MSKIYIPVANKNFNSSNESGSTSQVTLTNPNFIRALEKFFQKGEHEEMTGYVINPVNRTISCYFNTK